MKGTVHGHAPDVVLLVIILAGLLLIGNALDDRSANTSAQYTGPPKVIAELELDESLELYFFACDMVKAKFPEKAAGHCPVSPIVLFTPLEPNTHGEYSPGSRVVWLNAGFTNQPNLSTYGEGVAAHEMVHYILWDWELYQDEKDMCREEDLAWQTHDRWVESRHRPEDMNPEWWDWYEECDSATDDPRPVTQKVIEFISG